MTRSFNSSCKIIGLVLALLFFGRGALAATPDFFQTVVQPVGVAATQNAVFVSQPYCVKDSQTGPVSPSQWQILKIDTTGSQSVFAVLPPNPDYGVAGTPGILSDCEETYLAIAESGNAGGFTPGDMFATQGGHIYEFNASGFFVRQVFIPSLEVPFAHASLAFDTVGTFGNKLIVVGTDASNFGEVWTVDSAGNTVQLATLTNGGKAACNGLAGVPCLESPDVAPLTGPIGSSFPGWLFLVEPGLSGIAADIGALQPGQSTITGVGGVAVPEAAQFVPPSPACTFPFQPAGVPTATNYEFFNTNFSQPSGGPQGNAIFAYKPSAFAGLDGQLLVTTEGGSPGVSISTSPSITFGPFDPTIYNSEGSAFVQCVTTPPPTKQSITVEEFQHVDLDGTHLASLQARCAFLIQNGSGSGVCTCGAGDNALVTGPGPGPSGDHGVFRVSYFDVATSVTKSAAGYGGPGFSGGAGDNTVRIVNPTAANGNLCAMIYVFDDIEEMQTCCGCPVTPDGMRTLSVVNDLTFDFGVNRANLTAGVIDIIASKPNFTPGNPPPAQLPPGTNGPPAGTIAVDCSPTGAASNDPRATPVNPTSGLDAWITHDESLQPGNL